MFKFIYSIFTISWRELLNWFHSRQNSLWGYIGKVLIGILIYVMVNDALDKFIAKVLTDQTEEEVHFSDVKEKGYSLTADGCPSPPQAPHVSSVENPPTPPHEPHSTLFPFPSSTYPVPPQSSHVTYAVIMPEP